MDIGTLRGVIAVVTLLTFLGICWWAYRPGNRRRFEEDAWMAFDEEEREISEDDSSMSKVSREGEPA